MSEKLSKLLNVPRMERESEEPCVTFVGIAGAGKSTLGLALAERLGWAHVDTDRLLETFYGCPLQQIMDSVGLEAFLAAEEHQIRHLNLNRAVVSTGGSVVYSEAAVAQLKKLGPIIHLHVGFATFEHRVGDACDRALCIGEKTRRELYDERLPLYRAAADFTVETDQLDPHDSLEHIASWLAGQGIAPGGDQ